MFGFTVTFGLVAWTISGLVDECGRVLADEPQPSGRVADVPDLRTIRYYAALGLLDPPARFEKKRALYDERHLLQLLAIKRMQRAGLALADIQRRLAGASETRLRVLARPDHAHVPEPAVEQPPARDRFWARKPRTPAPVEAFRFAPGCTLLIEGAARPFTDDDAQSLRAWFEHRGLITEEPA